MRFLIRIRITERADDSNSAYCQDFFNKSLGYFCYSRESASNTLTSNFGIPFGVHIGGETEDNGCYYRRMRQYPIGCEIPKLGNGELDEVVSFAVFSGDEAAEVVSGAASVG